MSIAVPLPSSSNWTRIPAHRLFSRQKRQPSPGDDVVTAFRDGQVTSRANRRTEGFTNAIQEVGYQGVRRGDLVIHSMDGFAGAIGVSDSDGKMSPVVHIYTARDNVDARFFAYMLRTLAREGFVTSLAKGIRERSTAFDSETFTSLALPMPPHVTQRAIADYLDRETARIDVLISSKRRMIELVKERMHLLARQLTVRSGEAMPMRRILSSIKTGTTPPADELNRLSEGSVPWYSPGDVEEWLELAEPARTLKSEALVEGWTPRFPAQSTLLVGIGATAGKVAYLTHSASGNQQMTCLAPSRRVTPRFLTWQLFARRDEIRATAPFTTLPIINNEFIKSFLVLVPSLATQSGAVRRLDDEATKAQILAQRVERQVALLREHRQTLITAAVTGRLESLETV